MPSDVFDFELFDDFLEVGHDPNHKRSMSGCECKPDAVCKRDSVQPRTTPQPSGKSRWGDPALCGLLKRVAEFDQSRLAARHSGKGHAEWRWIFRKIERHDDGWI